MQLQESGEMYLETIYLLTEENPNVRSIDVCEHMGFSKPSVSRAVGLLKNGGFITVNEFGHIQLTDEGLSVAQRIYERHTLLSGLLTALGVDPAIAAEDACRIEHVISEETFEAFKAHAAQFK